MEVALCALATAPAFSISRSICEIQRAMVFPRVVRWRNPHDSIHRRARRIVRLPMKPPTVMVGARVSIPVREALEAWAEKDETTVGTIVAKIIADAVKRHEKRKS